MINRKKTIMAVFMVLAMLAVAVVPLTESQSDGAVGDGGTYTYVLTYDPTAMTTGSNAISTADMTPISHVNTGVFEGMDAGSWTWNTTTGIGPFNSFYGAFDMTDGNKFFAVLNPYDLTETIDGESLDPISNYNIMWVLPTVYWKVNDNTLTLSNDPNSGGTAYAHTIDGNVYTYVAYGVYEGSTKAVGGQTVLTSESGATPSNNQSIETYRTYAHNYTMDSSLDQDQGIPAYSMLWNFYQWTLYKMCCYAVMEDFNSQEVVGAGHVYGSNRDMTTGLTNALGPYAGNNGDITAQGGGNTYGQNAVKLFIENSWGNVFEYVDGIVTYNGGVYLDSRHSPTSSNVGPGKTQIVQTLQGSGYSNGISTNEQIWGMGTNTNGSGSIGLTDVGQDLIPSSDTYVIASGYASFSSEFTKPGVSALMGFRATETNNYVGARLAFVYGDRKSVV